MVERLDSRQMQRIRLLGLILPEAERHDLVRRYGVEARPALLSAVVGFFELVLGILVYIAAHPGFGGPLGLIAWYLNPVTWFGLLLVVTALFRWANYFANRDSLGEPLVWLFLRVAQLVRGTDERRRRRRDFGPERPDRIVVEGDGGLALLASRAKPGWDEYSTVRVEDSFFKITGVEERTRGGFRVVAYLLDELPESEVLRGIVHTEARLPRPG